MKFYFLQNSIILWIDAIDILSRFLSSITLKYDFIYFVIFRVGALYWLRCQLSLQNTVEKVQPVKLSVYFSIVCLMKYNPFTDLSSTNAIKKINLFSQSLLHISWSICYTFKSRWNKKNSHLNYIIFKPKYILNAISWRKIMKFISSWNYVHIMGRYNLFCFIS